MLQRATSDYRKLIYSGLFLEITQDSNQIKKIPQTLFYVENVSAKNIEMYDKFFKFSDKIPSFSKTIELCVNFLWHFPLLN